MRKYIDEIVHLIETQSNKSDSVTIIRLEGFENPIIYKEVCKYFKSNSKIEINAKLAKEKYNEYKEANNNNWIQSIKFLEENNYVDFEGAMTKWRNNSTEIEKQDNVKNLVLLMATEAVSDKGGLADFYKITPESVLERVKKNYSAWFMDCIPNDGFDKDAKKAINTFFKGLFKNINVNLLVLSDLADSVEDETLFSIDELIQIFCSRLSKDWLIPNIVMEKKIPKYRSLKSGKVASTAILEKSYKFITRAQFNKAITASALKSYTDKIDKYAIENNINCEEAFPLENPLYKSYHDFKSDLLDFILGKNNSELRKKFLDIDFAIIDSILNLKLEKEPTLAKEKENKIYGEPVEVYSEMIIKVVFDYIKDYSELPKEIVFKLNSIKITNCDNSKEDKEESSILLNRFRCRFGGLLKYFEVIEGINIKYFNNIDPFNNEEVKGREEDYPVETSSNINELSKVMFTVRASGEDEEKVRKRDYTYCFSNLDSWFNDYTLLEQELLISENGDSNIPLYVECSNIKQFINCEAEEEFFIKLQKIKSTIVNTEYRTEVSNIYNKNIINQFGMLVFEYNEFVKKYNESGIYSTYVGENISKKVFDRYSNLLRVIRSEFNNLSSSQKSLIQLILNIFLIGDKKFNDFKSGKCSTVILAPYHPIMLEKVYFRNEHIKMSLTEIIGELLRREVTTEANLDKRIDYMAKMCSINSGFNIYAFNEQSGLMIDKIYGKYAIYNLLDDEFNLLTDNGVRNDMLESEEFNNKSFKKKSHKSDIISQSIMDYIKTFPARADGINLLFINPDEIQHIVSGISTVVDILEDTLTKVNINLRILVPASRRSGEEYLKYWLNSNYDAENNIKVRTFLNYINFESSQLQEQVKDYIRNQDITYIYNILENVNIDFMLKGDKKSETNVKYPAIYAPMPIAKTQHIRSIDISQSQFDSSNEHLQLTHKYLRPNEIDGEYRVIKKMEIKDSQRKVINDIHNESKWVVCLDETIDKNILNSEGSKIISFSTGKGLFGELNTTVSARIDVLEDLQKKLKNKLLSKFNKWEPDMAEKAANNCIEISKNLDGSKMLKALNPRSTEIHNYLAYVMTMQAIHMNVDEYSNIIKVLINLDNYLHWFDDTLASNYINKSKQRPDFLVLEVNKSDEVFDVTKPLKIKATVIECKMSKENSNYLEEATMQIKYGIDKLANKFNPNNYSVNRRYWFNQLYRALVFSKINMNDNEDGYDIVINKLSNIFDGKFEIEWNGKVFAYWIDINSDTFECTEITDREDVDYKLNKLEIYTGGQLFIQKLLLPKTIREEVKVEFSVEEVVDDYDFTSSVLGLEVEDYNESIRDFKSDGIFNEKEKVDIKAVSVQDETMDIDKRKDENLKEEYEEDNTGNDKIDNINVTTEEKSLVESELEIGINNKVNTSEVNQSGRFLLGVDIRSNEKIYWEYMNKQLNNRHLLINGNSGSGKTYCIQALILEAIKNNISVIVFDYTDGFTRSKLSPILLGKLGDKFESRLVKYKKFPINPFKKGTITTEEGEMDELDQDVANRIADSFAKVYKFKEQQRSAIYVAVREALKEYGETMTLETLREKLKESDNKSAVTVLSKIEPLVDYEPFLGDSSFSWKDIVQARGQMYVIQLTGYTREIQLILTELILWDIWNYSVKYGNESTPMPLVLDEAQNLSHDENSPSGKILAEGRKFGVSGWYATQFMAGRLTPGEIGNLQQSAQKLYFSPPENSIVEVSKYIDITNEGSKAWAEKLSKLTKGYCVTAGYKANNNRFDKYEPRIIKITSLEDRINE